MTGESSSGTVVAVAGAKGGVGKTTTTLNLAAAYAARDVSVVAVELDLAMANVVDFLSFDEEPEPTVHDVLAGDASPIAAVREREEGFAVVPSGTDLERFAEIDLDELPRIVSTLRETYDVVLLDTGAGASRETIEPLGLADEVLLVATPEDAALRDAAKTESLTEHVDGSVAGLVVTKAGRDGTPDADRVADHLGDDMLGHVPEDDAVPAAQRDGTPVVLGSPDSPAAEAYHTLARRLADAVDPDLAADLPAPSIDAAGDVSPGTGEYDDRSSDGDDESSADAATDDPDGATDDGVPTSRGDGGAAEDRRASDHHRPGEAAGSDRPFDEAGTSTAMGPRRAADGGEQRARTDGGGETGRSLLARILSLFGL